jgi:UDP-N-acetylglucosamine 1-carboxyvinyltransferase
VIPDRIEVATLLIAAAATQGAATIVGARADHLSAVLEALDAIGLDVNSDPRQITVSASARLRPLKVVARPYPGIPTDVQAQLMALLALADGTSTVADDVFAERFMHVAELNRLGADIERHGSTTIVRGVSRLSGAAVMASDLRASAALVLAGLAAGGETIVRRAYHLDRGYERLDRKLATLGARIVRSSEDSLAPAAAPLAESLTAE